MAAPAVPWLKTFIRHSGTAPEPWRKYRDLSGSGCEVLIVADGEASVSAEIKSLTGTFNKAATLMKLQAADVFIVPADRENYRCILTASENAQVIALSKKAFCGFLAEDPSAKSFVQSLERWALRLLPLFIKVDATQKSDARTINSSGRFSLEEGTRISVAKGVVWLSTDEYRPCRLEDFADAPADCVLPLVPLLEFEARQQGELKPINPRVHFAGEDGAVALDRLSGYVYAQVIKRIQNKDHEYIKEEERKLARRKLQVQTINQRMISLLEKNRKPLADTDDALIKTCFEMINRQGWIPVVPADIDTADPAGFLERMADSSGLTIRFARLKAGWWQEDCGTFLAFDEEKNPFILTRTWRGYYYWDQRTGKRRRITHEETAARFGNEAVYYYKGFDNQKLKLKKVVLFEMDRVKKEGAVLLLIALVSAGITTLVPMITAFMLNTAIPGGQKQLLFIFSAAMVGIGLARAGFGWLHQVMLTRLNMKMEFISTAALWDRVLNFSSRILKQYSAGDLSSRMNSILGMQTFYRTLVQVTVLQSVHIIFSLGLMIWISFELAALGFASGLVSFLFALLFSWLQMRAFAGGEKSGGIVNAFVLEIFTGIHKIRAAAAEVSVFAQWSDRHTKLKAKSIASQRVAHAYSGFQTFWSAVSMAIIYYLVVQLRAQNIGLGSFIAFLSAYATMTGSLAMLSKMVMGLAMQIPMAAYVTPLLTNVPVPRSGKAHPKNITGNLKLEGVTYAYAGQPTPAVSNISVQIKKGEFTAVTGPSGCGKSTLVNIIAGLDKPSRGRVFLDDYDLETVDRHAIRQTIAIVQQNYSLFPGSLFENIKGATHATVAEVWEAAATACISEEIKALPMGLHTMVGGNAQVFSGGQIQRIAIARALIRKPQIIIFDESTSALDNRVQGRIMKNLAALSTTVIFVAHRLNVVAAADSIMVMDRGSLVEKGTWKELMENDGLFKKMADVSLGKG